MGFGFFADGLGANPVEALLHLGGRWALILLLLTLAVTPLRRLTGWNRVIKVRRLLGLFAFFYASLHLLIYLGLDQGFAWSFLLEDVLERPFITVGSVAFLLLVPLAVTSTRGWIRRLGKRWQRLHRLVYLAAALGVVHFYWNVKADTFWPLVAGGVLGLLFLLRAPGGASLLRRKP
jgi:sulfoxide reductase heme-binding subunit YedZ